MKHFVGQGTVLNAFAVLVGAAIGLAFRSSIREDLLAVVTFALGLVTLALALKMMVGSRNILVVAASLILGGLIGRLCQLDHLVKMGADWAQTVAGQSGSFSEGLVASSILFCVGPLTLLGCLEDALERKTNLLAIKSVLDGAASIVLAAALGAGVLATVVVVLIVQGALTLLASRLKAVADDIELMADLSGAGGCLLFMIGMKLGGYFEPGRQPDAVVYLPALLVIPLALRVARHFRRNKEVTPI